MASQRFDPYPFPGGEQLDGPDALDDAVDAAFRCARVALHTLCAAAALSLTSDRRLSRVVAGRRPLPGPHPLAGRRRAMPMMLIPPPCRWTIYSCCRRGCGSCRASS